MSQSLGICPVCKKGEIIASDKGYACNHFKSLDDKCTFIISKVMFGKELTSEDVMKIISKSEGNVFHDFISKKGTNYSARLVVIDGYLKLDFDVEKLEGVTCCNCDSEIIVTKKGYACTGYFQQICNIFVYKEIAGLELEHEDVVTLLSGGKTDFIKGLTSSKGKPFEAQLYIDENDFKIKFDLAIEDCPKCKEGQVLNFSKAFSCSNWNREKDPCNFAVFKEQSGGKINVISAQKLIREGFTNTITFATKDKVKYKGKLVLTEDFKVQLVKEEK